jgi:hypothetical protein
MSTPYGISTSIGSMTYDNYVNAPINGPLSTNQFPCSMPYHSYGTLVGIKPTPPQFYPSQEPIYSEMNTNARQQYLRSTGFSKPMMFFQNLNGKLSESTAFYSYSNGKYNPTSTHMNYIKPMQSSMYVNVKKSITVGKSSYKVGLSVEAPISTKNYYPSGTRSSLRRARSSGSVAPKKKGAIENSSLRTIAGGWGSLPRNTY